MKCVLVEMAKIEDIFCTFLGGHPTNTYAGGLKINPVHDVLQSLHLIRA